MHTKYSGLTVCDCRAFSTMHLEDALRDRLVCGIHNNAICKRLLAEDNLDLKKAEQIATAMEIAARDASELTPASKGHDRGVHQLSKLKPSARATTKPQGTTADACYRCGKTGHPHHRCFCRDSVCRGCGKTGHILQA